MCQCGGSTWTEREKQLKRRLHDARFSLMKPMDTFDCDSTPELDVRLIKELADGQYVRQARVERNIGYYTVSEFS